MRGKGEQGGVRVMLYWFKGPNHICGGYLASRSEGARVVRRSEGQGEHRSKGGVCYTMYLCAHHFCRVRGAKGGGAREDRGQ